MNSIKAIFMDLDGTLVHDGNISKEDMEAVNQVQKMGIPVIPATTRMRFSAHRLTRDLNIFDNPIVCLNGAMVLGPGWDNHPEIWMEENLRLETAKKIAGYADENDYEITTIFAEKKYWKERRDLPIIKKDEKPIALIVRSNIQALEDGAPISYMMHTEINGVSCVQDMERFVCENLKDHTCIHRHHRLGELKAMTIYPKDTSKLKGVRSVCKVLDISLKDVMTIGDDEVDRDMLEAAGLGVAMGNSPTYIKDVADVVAPSCTENGVAWTLKEYILKS